MNRRSPLEVIPGESSVRVTLSSGETITVENPAMRNDSIVGTTTADGLRAIPISEIESLETRKVHVLRTVGLIVAGAAVALFGWAYYALTRPNF